ncbi:MAG: CBS domain-containing protein [Mariprofundaceae bacterium]|nr:CBS domain-containing protein [Mariprofundaceae bacterium]
MQLAKNIMNAAPPYCLLDTPVKEVIQRFSDEQISGMLVVDSEDRLRGVITESDLVDQQARLHVPTAMVLFDMIVPLGEERFEQELKRLQALQAADLMVEDVSTVAPDDGLDIIASLMSEAHVHHLPVVDDGIIMGVISRHDVVKALAEGRNS